MRKTFCHNPTEVPGGVETLCLACRGKVGYTLTRYHVGDSCWLGNRLHAAPLQRVRPKLLPSWLGD